MEECFANYYRQSGSRHKNSRNKKIRKANKSNPKRPLSNGRNYMKQCKGPRTRHKITTEIKEQDMQTSTFCLTHISLDQTKVT